MDDLQQAKKFLKMVAKSQTKAERQRIKVELRTNVVRL